MTDDNLLPCVCPPTTLLLNYIWQVAAYDNVEKKMAFFDPSRAKDFLFISGTKVGTKLLLFAVNSVSVVKASW